MVSGRKGGPSLPGAHGSPSEDRLRALGERIDQHAETAPGANDQGLRALGEQIHGAHPRLDGAQPAPRLLRPTRRSKRWSTRRKVLTALCCVLLLAVLLFAGGYAYLRYQWSQVTTIQCRSCVAAADGAPFNVLVVGSDGQAIGEQAHLADTIKIIHVDPATGTARLLSIPRDTYVTLSGVPASMGLGGPQKINAAYDAGPNALAQTIENTFGIPISHFITLNFTGVINTVQTLGGINLHFNYPVRDWNTSTNQTESGLNIPQTGCITLNGTQTLALSRSRYYQYYANGQWNSDETFDIGRITRQNAILEAVVHKAESTYNPLTLNSFISAVVHDVRVDTKMTFGDMYALAERYHALSLSSLQAYTVPTTAATTPGGLDVEVASEPAAQQTIAAFLGTQPRTPPTPPVDQFGTVVTVPPASASAATPSSSSGGAAPPAAPPSARPVVEPYYPTPC